MSLHSTFAVRDRTAREVPKALLERRVVRGRTEVAAHDAVPCWVVLLVELLLDERRDILLDVVLL